MWERTLKDLIRGLRANKSDEAKFVAQAIDEIRDEVKSKDMELKAAAVLKLTYLEMLGYDMAWASFNVLEVMSSARLHHKAVGYLAAGQSFSPATDVLMLTTNLLKKDLTSTPVEIAVALTGVSQFITPELAQDLAQDSSTLLTHSRAAVRKRAVLLLFKIVTANPDALPAAFPRLRDKLEDPDPGVVGATVSVLCELARLPFTVPDILPMAPQLFHILTTSSNNWMLIKVIKLFGILAPHEPRLAKKLTNPMNELINTTPAISLLYECVRTCIIGRVFGGALAQTCVRKLGGFLEEADQNLRYIALLGLVKIIPSHPELVAQHTSTILRSVDDPDISIRMRALDLLTEMVNEDNIQTIVQHLLGHLSPSTTTASSSNTATAALQNTLNSTGPTTTPPTGMQRSYRLALAQKILSILSADSYGRVPDMQWALSVLVDLAYVARAPIGAQIRDALVHISLTVPSVRSYAATLMTRVLSDAGSFLGDGEGSDSCTETLWAAAWIVGEYADMNAPAAYRILGHLTHGPTLAMLPPTIQIVYLGAIPKALGRWLATLSEGWNDKAHLELVRRVVRECSEEVQIHASSDDCEVQERAANLVNLLAFVNADLQSHTPSTVPARPAPVDDDDAVDDDAYAFSVEEMPTPGSVNFPKSLLLLQPLFGSPLGASPARKVPVPVGLDLNVWIVPPPKQPDVTEDSSKVKSKKGKSKASAADGDSKPKKKKRKEQDIGPGVSQPSETVVETQEERLERDRRKAERVQRMRDDPFYLFDDRPKVAASHAVHDIDSVPIVRLEMPSLSAPTPSRPLQSESPAYSLRASTPGLNSHTTTPRTGTPSYPDPGPDSPELSSTPDPIKVVRAKKKKTTSSAKSKQEGGVVTQ